MDALPIIIIAVGAVLIVIVILGRFSKASPDQQRSTRHDEDDGADAILAIGDSRRTNPGLLLHQVNVLDTDRDSAEGRRRVDEENDEEIEAEADGDASVDAGGDSGGDAGGGGDGGSGD